VEERNFFRPVTSLSDAASLWTEKKFQLASRRPPDFRLAPIKRSEIVIPTALALSAAATLRGRFRPHLNAHRVRPELNAHRVRRLVARTSRRELRDTAGEASPQPRRPDRRLTSGPGGRRTGAGDDGRRYGTEFATDRGRPRIAPPTTATAQSV
jgi:hypothetical protein